MHKLQELFVLLLGCEDEQEESPPKKKRLGMDPSVDTKFLPDKDRDDEVFNIIF